MTKGKDFGTFPALEKILKRIHLSFHLKLPENEKKKKRNLQRQKNLLPPSLPEGGEAGMGPGASAVLPNSDKKVFVSYLYSHLSVCVRWIFVFLSFCVLGGDEE